MKIYYDDIIYSLQKSGGISVYWSKLEEYIKPKLNFVYNRANKNIFYKRLSSEILIKKNVDLHRYLNPSLNEKEKFIFHSSYYRYCKNKSAINITTVHDFTYEYFRKDLKSFLHKIQKKNSVLHSDGVICISKNTEMDLHKYYPKFKGKTKVIYHGYDSKVFFYEETGKSNNVIFVGSRVGYKNFKFTIDIVSKIKDIKLLIIGGGPLVDSEKNYLESMLGSDRYKYLGFVSNEELSSLYRQSFCLFYPSTYEGFGFPVLEAQACGCPVVCQNCSSIPEVSGDKCLYIDENDLDGSVSKVNMLFDKDFYLKLQNDGLENVKRFSWEKCINETESFYKECFEKGCKE